MTPFPQSESELSAIAEAAAEPGSVPQPEAQLTPLPQSEPEPPPVPQAAAESEMAAQPEARMPPLQSEELPAVAEAESSPETQPQVPLTPAPAAPSVTPRDDDAVSLPFLVQAGEKRMSRIVKCGLI